MPKGERAGEEGERILRAVKEAGATSIWLLISDARDEIVGYMLDRALTLGLKVMPVLNPYVSTTEHPEVRIVNHDGTTSDDPRYWNIGCFNHPLLMETARDLAKEFSDRYGDHPALYRIGKLPLFSFMHEAYYRNDLPEFSGGPLKPCCYCEYCIEGFRRKMRRIYSSLALLATHELNDFYPCTYQCVYSGNDIFRMARVIDVGHEDMHPLEFDHRYVIYVYEYINDLVGSAMGFDKLYTANGQAFNSWMGYRIPPGSMIEQVYSRLIHGSLGLVWWVDGGHLDLWYSTREANEIYKALVSELKGYEMQRAEVALLYSWTSMELKRNDFYYMNNLLFYTMLARSSVPVDIVSEQQILTGVLDKREYKLLCVVGCPTLPPEVSSRIREFVEKGGTVILDYAGSSAGEFQQVCPELVATTASRHTAYTIETNLPWLKDLSGKIIPIGVTEMRENLKAAGGKVVARFEDGEPALVVSRGVGGR